MRLWFSKGGRTHEAAQQRVYRGSLRLGGAVGVLVALLFSLGIFQYLELRTLDARFYWRGELPYNEDIAIVAIDEASFGALNLRWPWPRSIHAELVDALRQAGAKVIAFDILFAEPSAAPAEDAALAAAIRRAGNVVLVNKVTSTTGGNQASVQVSHPIEVLDQAAARVGLANMQYDQDEFVRRSFVAAEYNGAPRASFQLAILSAYEGLDMERIAADTSTAGTRTAIYGERRLPLAPDGSYIINYAGGVGSFDTYSYYQILNGMVPPEWLKDKIVLVGATDETLHDTFPTPFFSEGPMPGVEVHANALATLMTASAIRESSYWQGLLLILLLAAVTSWTLARLGPWKGLVVTGAALVGLVGVAVILFNTAGIWLPLVGPGAAVLGCYLTVTAYRFVCEENERRRIRNIFGRYVSDGVVKEIVDSNKEIVLGGERQQVTILFSDIRGFTSLSEKMPAEDVVTLLNEYFDVMTDVIFSTGGTIDKFVGDCIMALWGAPLPASTDAAQAVRAAVLMRQALVKLQNKWRSEAKEPFETGIGINTAEVVIGNIGSHRRLDYTVIGDGVNLAARLESATKELGAAVVISVDTYELVKDQVIARPLPPIMVKGKEQPVDTYEVLGWRETDGHEILVMISEVA